MDVGPSELAAAVYAPSSAQATLSISEGLEGIRRAIRARNRVISWRYYVFQSDRDIEGMISSLLLPTETSADHLPAL